MFLLVVLFGVKKLTYLNEIFSILTLSFGIEKKTSFYKSLS